MHTVLLIYVIYVHIKVTGKQHYLWGGGVTFVSNSLFTLHIYPIKLFFDRYKDTISKKIMFHQLKHQINYIV